MAVMFGRARVRTEERVAEALRRLADGMSDTMRELAESIAATDASAPEPHAGELAASLDVDEVAERTLEAVLTVPGVEAALIEASGPGGPPVRASSGLEPGEAEALSAVQVHDTDTFRAVEVTYRYQARPGPGISVRSAVVVPLHADGLPVGSLTAFTRSPSVALGESQLEELERIARRAGPALENARRFAATRALADLDALTGLHNRRYFHELLAREVARAQRYTRPLALIVLDLDDFKAINDRIGHLAGDSVLAEVGARVLSAVRTADVPCRVGGDEFAIVLPESSEADARLLADRIDEAIRERPISGADGLGVSAGIAALAPDDTGGRLFERADEALYRAKATSKTRRSRPAAGPELRPRAETS